MSVFFSVKHAPLEPRLYADGWVPVECASLDRMALAMTRSAWSPIQWHEGRRANAHFARANCIALDFDNGELELAQAVRIFCDVQHIIATTKSHQKAKHGYVCDRFRVVLALEGELTCPDLYASTVRHYIEKYDADPQAGDAARFFFPSLDIVSIATEGYLTTAVVRAAPRRPPRPPPPPGRVRFRTACGLRVVVPVGERNLFVWQAAKDLRESGRSEEEIWAAVLGSPTYRDIKVDSALMRELEQAIKSGIKSIDTGKAYGGRDGSRGGAEEKEAEEEDGGRD